MTQTRLDTATPKTSTSQNASSISARDRNNGGGTSRLGLGLSVDKLVKAGLTLAAVTQCPGAWAAGGRTLAQTSPPAPGSAAPVLVPSPPPSAPDAGRRLAPPPPPPAAPAALAPSSGNATAVVYSTTMRPYPATSTVNQFNLDNRAVLSSMANMVLLHDSQSRPYRKCMECDDTNDLSSPPQYKDYYTYPAAAPAGFTFKAVDEQLDLFSGGAYRQPEMTDVQSSYFLGSAGFDATLLAMLEPTVSDARRVASPMGSDVATQISYALFRFCDTNKQQSWVGVTSELPLDANGQCYTMLPPKDPLGRWAAWPSMKQKAFSKFLMSHPEMVQDSTQTGLNNIIGANPYPAMQALTCYDIQTLNAHAPINAVNPTPNFNGIYQQVHDLLFSRGTFAILTTMRADQWTRDATTIDASINQASFFWGGAVRATPLTNYGTVLEYINPNGGSTVIIPNHAYVLELGDPSTKTLTLTNPWGFNPTPNSNIDGSVVHATLLGGADMLWTVGAQLYIGALDAV